MTPPPPPPSNAPADLPARLLLPPAMQLFLIKLRMLLQRTRGGVLLLGAPESSAEPAAPEPVAAAGKEDEKVGREAC